MKLGVAGVRLCDQSGCYDRWPCARHGTLVCDHDERGPACRVGVVTRPVRLCEPAPCRCGYIRCSCRTPAPAPAEAPGRCPAGWYYLPATKGFSDSYEHEELPWEYGKVYFMRSNDGWGCEADPHTYLSPYRAMFEAEKAYERDQEEIDHG